MKISSLTGLFFFAAALILPGAVRPATVADAKAVLDAAEAKLLALSVDSGRSDWVKDNFITDDTEILAAEADERVINATVDLVKQSKRFDGLKMPADLARKMKLLRLSVTVATPSDPKESAELTRILAAMEGTYGKGKYCPGAKCYDLEDLSKTMAESRNVKELRESWLGWHAIAPPIRKPYARYVELANKGARELGFADTGAMWRSKYDMAPDAFAKELDRLWAQVRPLYLSLHAYARNKLREKYGDSVVPASGPIPADLLGNMLPPEWENIYPLVAPADAGPGFDLTAILKSKNTEPNEMVRYGEHFFTSLGFAPLPPTFWDRSLFVHPRDREVVCHASASDAT